MADEDLKLFTNGCDTFVARDMDDLQVVYKEFYGSSMNENDEELNDWKEVPGESDYKVCDEEVNFNENDPDFPKNATFEHCDYGIRITAKASEWANANGRGFLCSTEV